MNRPQIWSAYYSTLVIGALAVSHSALGEEPRLTIRKDPNDPQRTQCNIVFATFDTPSGWTAHPSDKNTYAILTPSKEVYPNVTRMVTIDIGKPVKKSAKETAQAFAEKWKGNLSDSESMIDGERAFRVTAPSEVVIGGQIFS